MGCSEFPKRIAVLVLNFNGAHFLPHCFHSLLEITYPPFDIYLIDNGSTDSSAEWARTHCPEVRVIENEKNLGFAGAYDRVIRELDHEYVVLLNNDTVVDEKWLEALLEVAESNPKVGACGSKILMMWDRSVIDHAGGMLTVIGSGLDLGKWLKNRADREEAREIGFGCGCSLLIRRETYLEVGGFDPDYFMYHEDVDLCWRMRLFGYSVMYVPDSLVYHSLGGGKIRGTEYPSKTYLCQKNRLANMIKNMGPCTLARGALVSAAYDAIRMMRFIGMRRFDLLKMLFLGYVDTMLNLKGLLAKRSYVESRRKLSDRQIKQFFNPLISSAFDYGRLMKMQDK